MDLNGELRFMPPKTLSSNRIISLDPETSGMLRQHRANKSEAVLAGGDAIRDDVWLFTAPVSLPGPPKILAHRWQAQRAAVRAEMPGVGCLRGAGL